MTDTNEPTPDDPRIAIVATVIATEGIQESHAALAQRILAALDSAAAESGPITLAGKLALLIGVELGTPGLDGIMARHVHRAVDGLFAVLNEAGADLDAIYGAPDEASSSAERDAPDPSCDLPDFDGGTDG
jgi:hypothetical protein